MIEFFKENLKIDFVGKFKIACTISFIICALSIYGTIFKMKYGVDFSGGAEIQLKFDKPIDVSLLRTNLEKNQFSGASVLSIGKAEDNEFLVRVQGGENDLNKITESATTGLKKDFPGVEVRKIDIVGPKAGAQLRVSGFLAMVWALIAIMVYIGMRFDFKFGPGAIIATLHDVCMVLGVYVITQTEFTLQTVAAMLAIIGYSVNDTVVIYDRVREHEEKGSNNGTLMNQINEALNETLSRTILTAGATLVVCIAMYFLGGIAIRDFFLAMSVGIISGSYSSLYIAAPVTLFFDKLLKAKA